MPEEMDAIKMDANSTDLRTDAEKFEDSLRTILSAPKKEVDARIAEKKQQRQATKQHIQAK